MAIFRSGVALNFDSIINGLRRLGSAAQSVTRIATPSLRMPMPETHISSIIGQAQRLQNIMSAISTISRVSAVPRRMPAITATMPEAFKPQFVKPLMEMEKYPKAATFLLTKQFEQLGKAFEAKDFLKFKDAFERIRRTMQIALPPEVWQQTGRVLSSLYGQLHSYDRSVKTGEARQRVLNNAKQRLQTSMEQSAAMLRKQVTAEVWGRVPVVGGIMRAIGGYQAQRAEMQKTFGALKEAGVPVSGITRAVSALTLAAGPIGVILDTVKEMPKFFIRIVESTIRFGISLAKLPVNVLNWIYRSVQSLAFSFLMFFHIFQRFFGDALKIVKNIQVATLVASGGLDRFASNIAVAIRLGTKYAVGLFEISEGFVQVSKAGFNVTEQQHIMNAAVKHASVYQQGLTQTIDQLIIVLRAWDVEASNSVQVMQVLHSAISRTRTTTEGLSVALGYGAAAAESLNITYTDTVAIISKFIDKGLQASRAGMAFRTMVAGVDKAIGHAVEGQMDMDRAIEILGIDWAKYAGDTVDLIGVMEDLATVTQDGVSAQERLAMMQLFGRRYYAQIIRLLNESSGELREFAESLKIASDLEERASKMSSSLIGIVTRLNNVWQAFKISILEGVRGPLESADKGLDRLRDLAERTGAAIGKLLKSTMIEPAVNWIKEITSPESMNEFQGKIDTFVKQIGIWFERLRDASIRWIEKVTGEAYSGASGIIDVFGLLMEKSIDISATVTNAFLKIAGESDRIVRIIDKVSYLVETLFPPFLNLILDVVMAILGVLDRVGIKVPDVATQIEQIKLVSRGLGDELSDAIGKGDERARQLRETMLQGVAEYNVAFREAARAPRETLVRAGITMAVPAFLPFSGIWNLMGDAAERLKAASASLEKSSKDFKEYTDRLPELRANDAAGAMNRQ